MATDSPSAIAVAFREQLLAFAPESGAALATTLGERLYIDHVPEDAAFPCGVLSVDLLPGDVDGAITVRGEMVLMLYGRPIGARRTITDAAGVAVQALRKYVHDGAGQGTIVVTGTPTQQKVPPMTDPADRELVASRVSASFYAHPVYLTQYAEPAG